MVNGPHSDDLDVPPSELLRLGERNLEVSRDFAAGWRRIRPDVAVPASALGNLPAGARLVEMTTDALEAGADVCDLVVRVHERDTDRLIGAAFAYQQQDTANGGKISGAAGGRW
jgi:hypothetical protein